VIYRSPLDYFTLKLNSLLPWRTAEGKTTLRPAFTYLLSGWSAMAGAVGLQANPLRGCKGRLRVAWPYAGLWCYVATRPQDGLSPSH